MPKKNNTKYVTVSQFAELLGLSKLTIYRYLENKKIPAFKIGGQWRINVDDALKALGIIDTNENS